MSYDTCKDHEILLSLIQFYLVNNIEENEHKNENNKQTSLSHALYNHIKLRLFCIDLLNSLFKKISVDYECLREILGIMNTLSFMSIVELNSSIVKLCLTILDRIEQSKNDSSKKSILVAENETDVSEAKLLEKEISVIDTVEKLALKIMSQIQSYVYQDVNLGELKKRLLDRTYDGLEGNFLNSTGTDSSSNTKMVLVKDTFGLMRNCLTTLIGLKAYCKGKSHLNKASEEASEYINISFENIFHRTVCKLPLSIKPISTLIPLLDSLFDVESSHLAEKVNNFVIRLLSTIKLCNSLKPSKNEKIKGSSDDESESNSERVDSARENVLDSKTSERLKSTVPYMIQILNKTIVNACYHLPIEKFKDSFTFYMISLFGTKQDNELSENELVGFRHIALKGLNGIFATSIRDNDTFKEKIALFSKYAFEESFVFLFSSVQMMFSNPSVAESEDQYFTMTM